jgi:hypothetical protein
LETAMGSRLPASPSVLRGYPEVAHSHTVSTDGNLRRSLYRHWNCTGASITETSSVNEMVHRICERRRGHS